MGSRGSNRSSDIRFKTDADISSASRGSERPLQRWSDADADTAPAASLADMSLDAAAKDGKSWDQFAANREKFGIVPSYDEHLYTTAINRSHPEFASREQTAARIAKEIEGQGHNGNAHVAEERGAAFDDSSLDEEDKYSGVARGPSQPSQPSQQQRLDFATGEARRAMASPSYLSSRERADRQEDFRKFSKNFKIKGEVPADLLPILGKTPKEPAAARKDAESSSKPAPKAEAKPAKAEPAKPVPKAPRKFDFAASAAKASSFKSPSPHQSFTPMHGLSPSNSLSPVPPPSVIPGMPPMMSSPPPQFSPFGPPPPGTVPGMGLLSPGPGIGSPVASPVGPPFGIVGPSAPNSAEGRDLAPVDVTAIKPLGNSFDFVSNLEAKGEPVPKMYATAPKWPTTSTVSFVDQFPSTMIMPRMPTYMPPVGYMMPPQF